MDSFNKTNGFEVLVEIFESKHKFIVKHDYRLKMWTKLKKSIEIRINKIVSERMDFKYHSFEVLFGNQLSLN